MVEAHGSVTAKEDTYDPDPNYIKPTAPLSKESLTNEDCKEPVGYKMIATAMSLVDRLGVSY